MFDWGKLPDDSVVVDVGGNVGTVTRTIMKAHPRLRYVVQDLDKTIVDAKGVSVQRVNALFLALTLLVLLSTGKRRTLKHSQAAV